MIQKITTGRGFRGVLNYVLREGKEHENEEARIIGGNMNGEDARDLAAEFGVFRGKRPDIERAVHHVSLRLPDEEHLTPEQWHSVAQDYLKGMGFENTPYVVVDHDKDHNHIHIVASRIDAEGQIISDSHERYRSQDVVYGIEEKYNLRHAYERTRAPDHERSNLPSMSRTEQEIAARTGDIPPKILIAEYINKAIDYSDGTRESFTQELEELGVKVHWNQSPTSGLLHGASYELEDYEGEMSNRVQGRQIGKDYSWVSLKERLQERAHEYEQEQRLPEPERAREPQKEERDIATAIKEPDRKREPMKQEKEQDRGWDHDR